MTDTAIPVLVAGQTRDLTLDGTTYTVRALTYAENAALQVARAAFRAPSDALLDDVVRRACEEMQRPDLAAAIAEHEAADQALTDFFSSCPPSLDEEGRTRWFEENHAERVAIASRLGRAQRRRQIALDLTADHADLRAMRERVVEAMARGNLELVAAGLAAIDGKDIRLTPEEVAELPAPHVAALAEAVGALLSPSVDARKN
jgi:hypothetical protein